MSSRSTRAGLGCLLAVLALTLTGTARAAPTRENLDKGWKLQSACAVDATGERISMPAFRPTGWIDAVVPGTVLGSQVASGLFPNPFFGMNLRTIPGTDYPLGKIFGYLTMNEKSPYHCSWWYRVEFAAAEPAAKTKWLHFDGINYRANIWLNGKLLADSKRVAGAFRSYDFDVSSLLVRAHANVLAVEVTAQTEHDLGIDFLDWNPAPADKSMGLWRGVSLATTGPVTIRNPAVSTHFLNDALTQADLRVVADVANSADHPVTATVSANVGTIHVEQQVMLAAHAATVVSFDATRFTALGVNNPEVWWPYQYGVPHLESLQVEATVGGVESDSHRSRFGIRESESFLNKDGYLQFRINHRDILIRGGGWTPDLFYRESATRLRQELEYVKQLHLNTIRFEGKLGSDEVFDLADEMGILVMPGWQCCDFWQSWGKWTSEDHAIAHASLYSQISRLRSHASMLVWLNGSDEVPSREVETDYLAVLKERDWANPVLNSAAERTSKISGPGGTKMSGPYDYVPPEYWTVDTNHAGGAFGFNTETGPGAAVPSAAIVRRTLPQKSWWPIDEQWNYHAALGKFAQYGRMNDAMNATYGPATSLENYTLKAQVMAYDGERAMFEAYGANKYRATGVIQWMLNNAWPSFFWHLYDYSLEPGGGFFGTRKANEPLHVQYRYDDRGVVVVNSTLKTYQRLHVSAAVFDLAGKQRFVQEAALDVAGDGVANAFAIPAQTGTTFLELKLRDPQERLVSRNVYWIPEKLAQMNWGKTTYVNTPASSYSDMRGLSGLPQVEVQVSAHARKERQVVVVELHNSGKVVGFFVHARVVKAGTNEEILPVLWEDNFVSLMPGESDVLVARGLPDTDVDVKVDGWNVEAQTVQLR